MERVLEIPEFLAHLKTYGGYPIPFTQLWAYGKPDFRAADMEHCARSLRDKLCSICGRRLGEYCYFIGGPLSKKNRLFVGSDGSSARHNVHHADLHKEGPGGHSKWKSDDSGRAVDWLEGIYTLEPSGHLTPYLKSGQQ